MKRLNLHNRAAYGKQTTAQLPLRAGRYERHFPQATLRSLVVMNIQPFQGCFA
ncbi:MAG: hypothetical protein LBV41_04655 [Cytophagaceae bacterium]|nr:hypothetical protein [Cytophagaceae bacterium]